MIPLALASCATIAWLVHRRMAGEPLLRYEPRRPVPWNFVAVALVLSPAVIAIVGSSFTHRAASEPIHELTPQQLWGVAASHVVMTLLCFALLAAVFGADGHDLGLPHNAGELRRDLAAGSVAYLAALLPVCGLQYTLTVVLAPEEMHPIIEQLLVDNSSAMMAAAAMGAVVGAPLFEETAFRLIFQGWLERHEAPQLATGASEAVDVATDAAASIELQPAEATEEVEAEGADAIDPEGPPTLALSRYVADRPCNWAAILVSSSLFALAHVGQGVAPFSLFPLGLALGYLYHRTHRILPSMVCHALFNATSLLAIWVEAGTTVN